MNESFESMKPIPNTPVENQALAQERAKQAAANAAAVERSQEQYARQAQTARSLGGTSIPALPAGLDMRLSRGMQAELQSLEASELRAEKARRLPDLRDQAKRVQKKADNLQAHLQKAMDALARLDAVKGTDKDDPQKRLEVMTLRDVLSRDAYEAYQVVGAANSAVAQLERELRDPLVEFCAARVAWIEQVLEMLPPLLEEARGILEAKRIEVETGRPNPVAKPRRGPEPTGAMKPMKGGNIVDLGTFRNNPR